MFNRVANGLYPRMVNHWIFYTLGNGPTLDEAVKKKLGRDFSMRFLIEGAIPAANAGVCYGFWSADENNADDGKIIFFDALQGFPLLDRRTSDIRAFIRFWQIDEDEPFCVELFEIDGITEYEADNSGGALKEIEPKKPYKTKSKIYPTGESEVVDIESYSQLPIFPLYVNATKKSELTKNLYAVLNAIDFLASNWVHGTLTREGIIWLIQNFGGDSLEDMIAYIEGKIFPTDEAVNTSVSAQAVEQPHMSASAAIELLERMANVMFSMPDTVGNIGVTATEIKDANKYLDSKADILDWRASQFVANLLRFRGVEVTEDDVKFKRASIVNISEEVDNIDKRLSGGWVDIEWAIEHDPGITDDERQPLKERLALSAQEEAEEDFPLEEEPDELDEEEEEYTEGDDEIARLLEELEALGAEI